MSISKIKVDFKHPCFIVELTHAHLSDIGNISGDLHSIFGREVAFDRYSRNSWKFRMLPNQLREFDEFCVEYNAECSLEAGCELKILYWQANDKYQYFKFNETMLLLRPFQVEWAKWALRRIGPGLGLLCADDVGAGKTLESIALVSQLQSFPCIVVCPSAVKPDWQKEVNKWTSCSSNIIRGRSNRNLPVCDFNIINYEILSYNIEALTALNPKMVIFDEMHLVRNFTAKMTVAAFVLSRQSKYVIGLTGTPVVNRAKELWSQMRILGREFCPQQEYFDRYCNPKMETVYSARVGWTEQIVYSGSSNQEELRNRISNFFIRRTKKEIMPDLPELQWNEIYIEIDPKYMLEYNREEKRLKDFVDKNPNFTYNDNVYLGHITRLMKVIADGKKSAAISWISNFLESGEKLVAFAHHKELQQALSSEFGYPKDSARIFGGDSDKLRVAEKDRFVNDPDCKLIVCSLKAAQAGIDGMQHAASNLLLVESDWTPSGNDQAIGRIHRSGQENSCFAWVMIVPSTIDERKWTIVNRKRTDINQITGDSVYAELAESIRKEQHCATAN